MDSAAKHYWAFISYSSKDEKIARRLHRALEHYRVPRDLVGRPTRDGEPVPRRLFPIFRDRDELPLSADLGDAIEGALRASRYLIVLCSPSAAASRWVNEEIRLFKQAGGEGCILAIMLSGEPNASDREETAAMECFPPALRYRVGKDGSLSTKRCEPIAGDLRPDGDGWTACLQKAVAGITGIGLAALTKREAVRARRRRFLAAAALLLMAACLYGWWDYTRTKVAHYAHLSQRFGVPEGEGFLEPAAAARRNSSYLVATSRGNVRRVSHVNGSGTPTPDIEAPEEAAVQELIYRENGSLDNIEFRSPKGKLLVRHRFTQPETTPEGGQIVLVKFEGAKSEVAGNLITLWGPRISWSKWANDTATHKLEFDRSGRLSRRTYLSPYNYPRSDGDGCFGLSYLNESTSGLAAEVTRLNQQGQPLDSVRYERNQDGEIIAATALAADGRPIASASPWVIAKWTAKFDRWGNQIEEAYFLSDGFPAIIESHNACGWRAKFDERGNEIEKVYFDGNGNPSMGADPGYAKVTRKFDERGNAVEEAYFDENDMPLDYILTCAKVTRKYDERGNAVEEAYFGADGQPVLKGDYAKVTRKYDERGNQIEEAYFGADGQPALYRGDYAKVASTYDERGNEIETAYFGTDGQPVLEGDYAKVTRKYDERGNQIEEAYFGADGEPVLNTAGYARETRKYDERGNRIEEAYFGADGQPVLEGDYAKVTRKYDERGNRIEEAYFGTDGQPVLKGDYAKVTREFDDNGNAVEEAYFGTDGQPVLEGDYAKVTRKYDERGNQIEEAYFGAEGEPVLREFVGYAKWTAKFDRWGNELETRYFGTDGKPILNNEGYAKRMNKFDKRGNLVETAYFGLSGERLSIKN